MKISEWDLLGVRQVTQAQFRNASYTVTLTSNTWLLRALYARFVVRYFCLPLTGHGHSDQEELGRTANLTRCKLCPRLCAVKNVRVVLYVLWLDWNCLQFRSAGGLISMMDICTGN